MKFLIVFVLVAWMARMSSMVLGAKEKPDECNTKKVDGCMANLSLVSRPDSHFPENPNEMNVHCKNIKIWEKCVKDYASKCLTSRARQTVQILIYSITRTNKGYCSNNRRKNSFTAIGVCINPHMPTFAGNMNKLNKAFHAAEFYPDANLRVPMLCCNYFRFKDTVTDKIEEICPKNAKETEHLLDGFGQDVLNLLCGDYTGDSDKCQTILEKTPKWKKPLKYESFVIALAQVMASLPD